MDRVYKCEKCGKFIRYDTIELHMRKAHNFSYFQIKSKAPVFCIDKNTVNDPRRKSAINQKQIQAGLLAPVPESYLEKAIQDIYPLYGKVSFGSDMQKTEMIGIQKYTERNHNVNVYLFCQGYTRYKAILTNEFLIYVTPKPHPKPWGSWNLTFNNYYTVR